MNKIIVTFLMCFVALCVDAQSVIQRAYISDTIGSVPSSAWSEFDHTFVWTTTEGATLVVTKTDPTGYPIWSKEYLGDSMLGQTCVQVAGNGTIYVCGYTDDAPGTGINYFILCMDPWSATQWSKQYETVSQTEFVRPILHIMPNGDLWLTEGVNTHIGIIKTDPNGNLISSHMYRGDLNQEWFEPGFNSDICSDGTMLVLGSTGPMHLTIIKTDSVGQMLWYKRYKKPLSGNFPYDIKELNDGSLILVGQESQLPYVARLDSNGAFMWYRQMDFGASLQGPYMDIEMINDSTFIAAGTIANKPILTKFDIHGNVLLTSRINSPSAFVTSTDVAISSSDSIAWPGSYYGVGGPAIFMMFMGTLAAGTCIMDTPIPMTNTVPPDTVSQVLHDMPQTIVVSTITFTEQLRSTNFIDVCWVVGTEELSTSNQFSWIVGNVIEPSDPLVFTLKDYDGEITYSITDLSGRAVANGTEMSSPDETITISGTHAISSGMYILSIYANTEAYSQKFIVR